MAAMSGGGTTVSTGGALAEATGGRIANASGGMTSSTGGTGDNATGGVTNPGSGGKPATGGTASQGTGGASTTPTRCSAVSGTVAKSLVDAGAILLDVRTASEFASNGLAGAINIPLADLPTRMTELDKSKNIVVYCASGNRSGQANTQLCDAGFNVFNLGAITNWPQ
jgi:phage shock protein E